MNKETRIAFATTDELEARIDRRAAELGITKSVYCETVLRDHLNSITGLQDLQDPAAITLSLHEHMRQALADGIISPVEHDEIVEHVELVLTKTRARRNHDALLVRAGLRRAVVSRGTKQAGGRHAAAL